MGSEVTVAPGASPWFVVQVAGTADLAQVELVKGHVGAQVPFQSINLLHHSGAHQADPTRLFWTGPDPHGLGDSAFYYLRVVQADTEMAWSSPIWIDVVGQE
jgi:hypothetical protein